MNKIIYTNIYNNLIILTRNKKLYCEITKSDTFSDRLIVLLFHFAFILKVHKNKESKQVLQNMYDTFFNEIELSIREIGYGDMSINKSMKDYINIFHNILEKIDQWENLESGEKNKIFNNFLCINLTNDTLFDNMSNYFDKYLNYLKNNTFNSLSKELISAL